jgi:Secretion system C-terminal sorting domain
MRRMICLNISILIYFCLFSLTTAQSLQYVRTVEITTDATGRGARPEIHFANDRVYIIYLGVGSPGVGGVVKNTFKVKVYDKNLENVLTEKIIVESDTVYGTTTDIRSVADAEGVYIFYEKANKVKDASFLFGEKYAFDEEFTKMYAHDGPIVEGAYWSNSEAGDELLDDPASLIVGDRVCVMTKIKGDFSKLFSSVPTYRIRELNSELSQIDTTFDVVIPEIRGFAWVSSLLYSDESIYHIQPSLSSASPPINLDLSLVRFSKQWQYESSDVTIISSESWSEGMPIDFAMDESGYYYLTYEQVAEQPDPNQSGGSGAYIWLKMYDNNFNEIQAIRLLDSTHLGAHASMAIAGDTVYVGYGRSVPDPYAENVVVDIYVKDISKSVEYSNDGNNDNLIIYPNPASEKINLEFLDNIENRIIKIYNSFGEELFSKNIGRNRVTSISTEKLPSGIYYLEIIDKNNSRIKKLIISK